MASSEATLFRMQAFQVPKEGQEPASCEDAFRVRGVPSDWDGSLATLRVREVLAAVTDGATQSSFPALWARRLASAIVETALPGSTPESMNRKLARHRQKWREEVEASLPAERPWYVEDALERGAYSTLLTLEVGGGRWEAVAIGDTCLFQIRGGSLQKAFPLEYPEAFDHRPYLVSSVPFGNRGMVSKIRRAEGSTRTGDTFLLATDALSKWILAHKGWRDLLFMCDGACGPQDFAELVAGERRAGRLEDDDSTLLVLRIP